MHVKVHGGTVRHADSSLCNTCCHSKIIRGETLNERIVECTASAMTALIIPFRVTFCNTYCDSRQPSYMDMVKIAWILTPHATKKRPAGFVRGDDLTEAEFVAVLKAGPDGT